MTTLNKDEIEIIYKGLDALIEVTNKQLEMDKDIADPSRRNLEPELASIIAIITGDSQFQSMQQKKVVEVEKTLDLYKEYSVILKAKLLEIRRESEINKLNS